jgi:lysyl-tRNA synthetase class 1
MTEDSMHWADQTARQIINLKGEKDNYVIESGITPSGMIHIGNFREIITADLIQRGFEAIEKKCTFFYIWDSYDVFRKVPVNVPNQEELKKHLHKPVFRVPDPYNTHKNYAEHFEKEMEDQLPRVGVNPTFVYQDQKYLNLEFTEEIKQALENTEAIKEILNEYRKEPLAESWLPIFVFCEKCHKDTTHDLVYEGDYNISYECACNHKDTVDFSKKGIVTLRWRVDWPMRWHKNKVDFESAGKDHFAAGGSVDTGRKIQEAVWKTQPPHGWVYEWISIKGGKQFSSSAGEVITLKEMLEIYEPQIIRHLFAGTRPNTEFAISFDLDVFKVYEDYDQCERIHYKKEEVAEKDFLKQKRIYELSQVDSVAKEMPFQPSLRHMMNVVQLYQGDMEQIKGFYKDDIKTKEDDQKVEIRAQCALNWLAKHAPEDFKFKVNTKEELKAIEFTDEEKTIIKALATSLETAKKDEKALHDSFYVVAEQAEAKPQDLFKAVYKALINKERGPRLANFILTIGIKEVIELVESIN